jgi:hypothetical protein
MEGSRLYYLSLIEPSLSRLYYESLFEPLVMPVLGSAWSIFSGLLVASNLRANLKPLQIRVLLVQLLSS